jgi:hypothetical protein
MSKTAWSRIVALAAVTALAACATGPKQPVLYPNAHYKDVGYEVAQMDIGACKQFAEMQVGKASEVGTVAKNTVGGAAIGAALGAVGGAIAGSPGTGAAVGAAVGGGGGAVRGTMQAREGDPAWRSYVEACLRDKGYEPAGWK